MNADSLVARIEVQLGSAGVGGPEAPSPVPPLAIPDYEIIDRIGSGSYGEVWLARSVTGTLRAVKVIRRRTFSNDRPYEREFRGIVQFEPVSRVHPHLICILHVGRDDPAGLFFYVMELADNTVEGAGKFGSEASLSAAAGAVAASVHSPRPEPGTYVPHTLAFDLKKHGRLPVADVLRLGVQLADALGHLHRHGLVHRDVKPSNVVFIRGQAKLADIGLVVGKDETRSFVGTEGFVPPEGHGTERADLFSLGRLLYEAAAGKDRCDFPELPLDLDCWPRSEREALLELNEVLLRACAVEASQRHANAAELAADLNLILGGHSVRRAYGIERRLRHARRVSAVALGVLGLAGAILGFQDHARRNAEIRASEETVLRQRAEAAERESRRQLYTALLEQARANRLSRELGQRVATLNAVRRAAAITNSAELRREAFAALALPDLRLEREVVFDPAEVGQALDPTFERFAVSHGRGPVEVRAVSDRRLLAALQTSSHHEAHLLTWSPDGRFLAFKRDHDPAGYHADLEVWDVAARNPVLLAHDAVTANALSFHPNRPEVMAGRADGGVSIWDLESARELHRFHLAESPLSVQYSPDGELFTAVYHTEHDSVVVTHDIARGTPVSTHHLTNWVVRAEWQPHGRWLVTPDYSGNVRLLDPRTGEHRLLGQHQAAAVAVAFVPEGDFMITGGWERELICWDLQTLQRAFTIGINSSLVRFHRDGRQCVIYTPNRALLYEFERPTSHRQFPDSLGRWLAYGAFSPDGQWLAASGGEFLGVWSLRHPGPAALIPSDRDRVPLFSPNGAEIYAYWEDSLTRWHISETAQSTPLLTQLPLLVPPHLRGVSIVSNELVLTCLDGIRFMPLNNTEAEKVRRLNKAGGWSATSPDGRWLGLRAPKMSVMRVYHLPEVEHAAWLTNRANVWTFAFSPGGDELAVATFAGLEFYDTGTWKRTRELSIPCERQASILFAPDGETFWFSSDARTSGLRDTRTLAARLPLPAGYLPLAVSADGSHLAVSVDMLRVQVWDLDDVWEHFGKLGLDWSQKPAP